MSTGSVIPTTAGGGGRPPGVGIYAGITILENPRVGPEGGNTLHFDAHLPVRDQEGPRAVEGGTLCHARYFNKHNYVFQSLGAFFILAEMVNVIANGDQESTIQDFSSDSLTMDMYSSTAEILSLVPIDMGQIRDHKPWFMSIGTVEEMVKDNNLLSFNISPEQYVPIYREYNAVARADPQSHKPVANMPLRCEIHESKRWPADKMPKVAKGQLIYAGGVLDEVIRDDAGEIEKYVVDVAQCQILTRNTVTLPPVSDDDIGPPDHHGLRFRFNRDSDSGGSGNDGPSGGGSRTTTGATKRTQVPSTPRKKTRTSTTTTPSSSRGGKGKQRVNVVDLDVD